MNQHIHKLEIYVFSIMIYMYNPFCINQLHPQKLGKVVVDDPI
jgi:hypothetical protein